MEMSLVTSKENTDTSPTLDQSTDKQMNSSSSTNDGSNGHIGGYFKNARDRLKNKALKNLPKEEKNPHKHLFGLIDDRDPIAVNALKIIFGVILLPVFLTYKFIEIILN